MSCRGKDGGCLKQPIGHRVGEEGAFHILHCRLDCSRVQENARNDFRALLAELLGSGIKFMDEGANRQTLLEQELGDESASGPLCTAGSAGNENWLRHE